MGTALSNIWQRGHPELHPCLESLRNWSREDIKEACVKFRSDSALAVNMASFMRVLGFKERHNADAAFSVVKNSRNNVEWLSVVAVMILMSDQKYISKVTFLFSLCDFNSSGKVNCAELCIGMRYLLLGISHFFKNATVPPRDEVERSTVAVFAKIDADKSNFILIEEIVSFAYGSKDLRVLLSPFPADDPRIFEELVLFTESDKQQSREALNRLGSQEQKMIHELRLTPDAATKLTSKASEQRKQVRKARARPWQENKFVTKPYAWLLYKLFAELKDSSHTIPSKVLLDTVSNLDRLRALMQKFADDPDEAMSKFADSTLAVRVTKHLTDKQCILRLEDHAGDAVSLRALFCLCCPSVQESEIEAGMQWCRTYRAHDILNALLKCKSSPLVDASFDEKKEDVAIDVDEEDIEALFEAIDMDHDGQLSVENLCEGGNLRPEEARRLVELWDRDRTGELSKGEILAIVHHVHSSVRQRMKALFAAEGSGRFC